MASSKGIRAGRAFVELFADDKKLVRGLRAAQRKLKAFGDSVRNIGQRMMALGAAVAAPLIAATKAFAAMGDSLAKMSARTGVSVEALSELSFAAEQSGTDVGSLEKSLARMQRSIYDAGRGLSTATDALADLGLTMADVDGLSPEEQFKLLGDRIGGIEDPTRKAAIAMSLFGRSGTALLPMFNQGAAGIEALQQEARALGLTMSGEDAAAAEELTDTLNRLWRVVKMGVFNIGSALAPMLGEMVAWMTRVVVTASEWIKANKDLIVTVMKVAAAVIAGGAALVLLGVAINGLGVMFGVLSTVVTTVGSLFGMLGAVIGALVSPIGIVVAALAGLGGYMLYTTGAGGKALGWLGSKFNILKNDAMAAFDGISAALAAGDIGLAMKVLWLTLKMEFTRGVNFLEKAWLNFRNFFIRIGYDAWAGLLAVAETVWHGLEVGWIETTAFFSKLWTGFTGFFAKTWQRIKSGAKKAWNWIKSLFDDSIDLEAENKLVEEQKQAAISQIDDEQQRKIAEREAKRQTDRERAAAVHEATLAQIGQENLDRNAALDAEYADRMSDNETDLANARQAWQDAIDEARAKRDAKRSADDDDGPGQLDGPGEIVARASEALASMGNVGEMIAEQAAKIGAAGTFNAANVQGLQAGGAADRTADATEATAKNTKRLLQEAQSGGLTFA